MTTLTIMRVLPREVDPMVYNMSMEDPAGATFAGIGGLGDQIRELREVSIAEDAHLVGESFFFLFLGKWEFEFQFPESPRE